MRSTALLPTLLALSALTVSALPRPIWRDCGIQGVTDTVSAERFRGVRSFDIADIENPKEIAAVQTCHGSRL